VCISDADGKAIDIFHNNQGVVVIAVACADGVVYRRRYSHRAARGGRHRRHGAAARVIARGDGARAGVSAVLQVYRRRPHRACGRLSG